MPDSSSIASLIQAAQSGQADAEEALLDLVYDRLHALAAVRMRGERRNHTLQPTALVNEAYLRLMGGTPRFENEAHFFGAAAEAMRRILVEHARRVAAQKRGGDAKRVTFDELQIASVEGDIELLALHDALDDLESVDERLAAVVKLRYFTGLSLAETAQVLDCSTATVKRDWSYARAWLLERMSDA